MLAAVGVMPSAHGSKLAQALGRKPSTGPRTPPQTKRKAAAGDVLFAYVGEQVQALKDQDPPVRLDTHDSVHKMRVATRRMRSVLATYR